MVTMYPIDLLKFVEIMSRHHETHKKKALKLKRPIQDHFSVSLVQNKLMNQYSNFDALQVIESLKNCPDSLFYDWKHQF